MDGELVPGKRREEAGALAAMPPIARQIWDMKYRLKTAAGGPIDQTVEDSWARVAAALAAPEREPGRWAPVFYEALGGFRFLPGGRVIAGAGSERDVTLFNCFVMGRVPDSIDGIFSHLREAALTMQQGGGIGYDFSTLRPKGAPVRGVGADASGPLSYMDVWDAMCRTIMSAGSRRGAMMAVLRCDHPDIEDFIAAKQTPGRLTMFNLSAAATDAFMAAVAADADWPLMFNGEVFRTVRAAALWDKIMRATYDYAEPGIIFIDRVNRQNNLAYCEEISATNPCGEQPLPPYGDCLLGSVNLAALVERPFTRDAFIDLAKLQRLTGTAVRLLDNVIDVSRFPLEAQRQEAVAKRRIGLGITGLADALIMCRLHYGSEAAVAFTEDWLSEIEIAAYLASIGLAAEKGAFPLYDRDKYRAGEHIRALPDHVVDALVPHGIRNSHLLSIAPTGTISLLAGNVSSGIEPVFAHAYSRTVLQPDGSKTDELVEDYAHALYRRTIDPSGPLPDYFVDAQGLTPDDHLVMMAAAQRHVDAAISKTINVPADIPFESFTGVYQKAYELGCKSCTTYRPNEVTGSVLSVRAPDSEQNASEPVANNQIVATVPVVDEAGIVRLAPALESPDEVPGWRYRIRWPDSDHALYVVLTDLEKHGRLLPWELFLTSNEAEADEWRVALGRMISAVFRRGGDVAFVARELQAIFDKKGGAWLGGRHVASLPAAIGDVIARHWRRTGFLPPEEAIEAPPSAKVIAGLHAAIAQPRGDSAAPRARFRQCPKCGQAALIRSENCDRCTSCDYAKC